MQTEWCVFAVLHGVQKKTPAFQWCVLQAARLGGVCLRSAGAVLGPGAWAHPPRCVFLVAFGMTRVCSLGCWTSAGPHGQLTRRVTHSAT